MDRDVQPLRSSERLNLNEIADRQGLEVQIKTLEPPDERDSRLRREEADARLQRWQNFLTFLVKELLVRLVALTALFAIGIYGVSVLIQTSSTATEKEFARSIVTPIVTGLIGFLLGKAER